MMPLSRCRRAARSTRQRRCRCALAGLGVLLTGVLSAAEVEIDTPRGGWREQGGAAFSQRIDYPAASVNVDPGQPETARIRGRIRGTDKAPATLVVNGVAMPMRIEDDASFDRPYSFPAGSNAVEVRAADGARARLQFHARAVAASAAKLRVVLSWDSDHTDLDLHVLTPDGDHAWYGHNVLANGAALDVDVTTGYGPEIFASPTPLPGTYQVYVNYFGGGYAYDDSGAEQPLQDLTVATISIISGEGTIDEKQQSFVVPMRAVGELTRVAEFHLP